MEKNPKLSRQLLESAKDDLNLPVYKGVTLKKLGLDESNAEKVLRKVEELLTD